jgi:glutathione reductase (NADPH)
MSYDFDLFTIGAGSGGVRASRIAAQYGARVAVAEERYLGGTCVNVGCIPKKLLVYAAHFSEDFADAHGFGWSGERPTFDWPTLIRNKDWEIARLNDVYGNLLDAAGVERISGRADLVDAHTVRIGDRQCTASYILIAVGAWPIIPQLPGAELAITSNEAFHLESAPASIVIVGGGYIACEFAGIFHGLGTRVTQIYRGPLFLRGFDIDVRRALFEETRRKGIDLRIECNVERIERRGPRLEVSLTDGTTLSTDHVMFAIGRAPHTAGLALTEAGVELDASGAVIVDEYCRSTAANIYAVGDVTNRLQLTPMAIAEGHAVAETLFNGNPTRPDYHDVPTAVFSQPPVGAVGLTEAEARERYPRIKVYRASFRPLKHTLSGREERTMVKLIVDQSTDRVVGCHMVGSDAAEIIQGLAVALKCGATKAQFDATIGIHPTAAEEFVTLRTPVDS